MNKIKNKYVKSRINNLNYEREYSKLHYVLFFFIVSFIGWMWEVLLHFYYDNTFVNRGTFLGPWLPIYGCGGLLILILLKRFRKKPIVLFLISFVLCGIVEYFTALYLETVKHLKYWDYTGYFLNINGRVCFAGLLLFALGGLIFVYFLAPLFDNALNKVKEKTKKIICIILLSLFVLDFIYSTFIKPNTGDGITTELNNVSLIILN